MTTGEFLEGLFALIFVIIIFGFIIFLLIKFIKLVKECSMSDEEYLQSIPRTTTREEWKKLQRRNGGPSLATEDDRYVTRLTFLDDPDASVCYSGRLSREEIEEEKERIRQERKGEATRARKAEARQHRKEMAEKNKE